MPSRSPADELRDAMETYRAKFGHGVPATVAMMFQTQPGPLTVEIRQAIAMDRPVPAWRECARNGDRQVLYG
jgi:hypothetical protein